MKYLTKVIFVLMVAFLLSNCQKSDNGELQYYSFKVSKSDKWGIIDGNGKVIVEDEFKNQPMIVSDGIFYVPNDDGFFQMYSVKEPAKEICSKFKHIAPFEGGATLTPCVKKGEGIVYIDKEGSEIISLSHNCIDARPFYHGWSIVAKDYDSVTKNIAVDVEGNFFEPSEYELKSVVGKDMFLVLKDDNYYIINPKEEELYNLKANVTSVSEDMKYYIFSDDNLYGLKSINGEVIVRAKYKDMSFIDDTKGRGLVFENDDNLYGVMDVNGEIILKDKYNKINDAKGDLFVVKRDKSEGYGLINKDGDKLLKFEYERLSFISGTNYLLAQKEGDKSIYIIDRNGNPISKNAEFYALNYTSDDYYSNYIIKSDIFDVNGFVQSILEPSDGYSYVDLFGQVGKLTEEVCKDKGYNIGYSDIVNDYVNDKQFLPTRYIYTWKFGGLNYQYGFDKVAESYWDDYYYETRYRYANCKCNCLKLSTTYLNQDVREHLDVIEEQFGDGLSALGFSNNGDYWMKDNLYLKYEIEESKIVVYIEKKRK